jgi:iron complex outermembrane receptor protein
MRRILVSSSILAMSAALGGTAFAQAADDPGTQGGQDIVVTGSRGQARTVATSPTPIDVISGEQIAQLGGSMQLRDVLSQLVPSFQSQQVGSSSWNSVTRPAGLRGLSGVHVLVLVNGKRRHNSALIDLNSGSTSMGGNPVDLDQIPASAIAHRSPSRRRCGTIWHRCHRRGHQCDPQGQPQCGQRGDRGRPALQRQRQRQ